MPFATMVTTHHGLAPGLARSNQEERTGLFVGGKVEEGLQRLLQALAEEKGFIRGKSKSIVEPIFPLIFAPSLGSNERMVSI